MFTMSQAQLSVPSLLLQLLSSSVSIIQPTDHQQPPSRRYFTSRPLLATTLLFLLLSPAPATAQTSPISNGCLSLSSSKACRGFKDYYVGVPALARYGLNTTFNTIDDFDQAISDYTTSTLSYIAQVECYPATDLASFSANSTHFPYARYSKSRICAALVQDSDSSLPCNYNQSLAPPPLCKATCEQWLTSVNSTIHDSDLNTCPNVNQPQVTSDLQLLASSCNDWSGFNGTPPNCVNGTVNEPDNCGFSNTTNDACTYCQQNSTDPCCQSIPACSNRKLSIGAIIGIVIGAVVAVVITSLAFFCFCCKRQNKRIRKENSFSFKTYVAPLTQRQQQQRQEQQQEGDHYSGNKVLLQDDYYSNHGDNHPSVGMVGTMNTQATGHRSQLSDPFGDHYEVISLANNPPPTITTPNSNQSTLTPSATNLSKTPVDVVLPLVSLDDPHPHEETDQNGGEPAYEEEFYQVVHPYPPQVADELGLQVGDIVCLAMGFDDGWALGFNVTTGSKGVFPLVCVSLIPPSVLEQLLTTSNSNSNEDPMADGLSTFSSKVLVEEEDATTQQQQQPDAPQRRLSRSSQLAISIRRIREDMRRSLSLSSSTASYPRHPSPLSATNSISSRSIRPSSPSPSHFSQTADIPRRTASMVRSNNHPRPSAATLDYAECDSPTSPTHQTPLFNDTHHLESFEMSRPYNHNRISKQES